MRESETADPGSRAAGTRSLLREVNQRIAEMSLHPSLLAEYVCECLDSECAETIRLTQAEYAHVRQDPKCFLVLDGHEVAEIDVALQRMDRYLIVCPLDTGA